MAIAVPPSSEKITAFQNPRIAESGTSFMRVTDPSPMFVLLR